MLLILYIIGFPIVCIVLCILLKQKSQQIAYLQRAVQNNSIIAKCPELTESQIEARYIRICFNNFIRKNFREVASWECPRLLQELQTGGGRTYQQGVRIYFLDGTQKYVYVNITPHKSLSCINCELDVKKQEDPKHLLQEWLKNWSFADKLLAQEEKEEGFLIPMAELPQNQATIDLLVKHISEQCGYSSALYEDGIRVAI